MDELYKKHRPTSIEEVKGQEQVQKMIAKWSVSKKTPHAVLITGPSGTGKTTCARILAASLGCSGNDLTEQNCSDFRGIDSIRALIAQSSARPLTSPTRVWIIDECHQLTSHAQEAFLKLLEDTPKHAYFILLTTEPGKLVDALVSRCARLITKNITKDTITGLVKKVAKTEKIKLTEDTLDTILEYAGGSARKALVALEMASTLESDTELHDALSHTGASSPQAIELCRLLLKGGTWKECTDLLRSLSDEPEKVRWAVLGYANAVARKGGGPVARAMAIIEAFRDNYYDCKDAGLTASCYEVMGSKK